MSTGAELSRKVTTSGLLLGLRRVLSLVIAAATTVAIARSVSAVAFGVYGAALSAAQLIAGTSDFGFSLLLGRDLSSENASAPLLLSTAVQLQMIVAVLLTTLVTVLALTSGITSTRGEVLIVLTPMVLTSGRVATRQYFVARFEVAFLSIVDVLTGVLAGVGSVAAAVVTGSVVAVAIVVSASSCAQCVIIWVAARRRCGTVVPTAPDRRRLFRDALPLGAVSIVSTFYFVIDLAILGWLVKGAQLGDYAAAVKILSVLVALPTLVMSVALPAFSRVTANRERFSELAANILQTMTAVCLPMCVAAGVFATTIVHVGLGPKYEGAIPLIRILACAGAVSCLANVLAPSYLALRLQRPQLISNVVALAFNVVGNLLLAPRYGVVASAWLTLATEMLVAGWALIILRHSLDFRRMLVSTWRPLVATCALAVVGLALHASPGLAIPGALAVDAGLLTLLRAWPPGADPIARITAVVSRRRVRAVVE